MHTNWTFVSYSRSDAGFTLRLANDLRARGADVWLDQLDIQPGSRWDTAVEGALRHAARVLVVLSPNAVASQNVLDEVSFALDEGKTVLPVLAEACAVPLRLRRLQHLDFTGDYDRALSRLLGALGVPAPVVASQAPAGISSPAPEMAESPPPRFETVSGPEASDDTVSPGTSRSRRLATAGGASR